MPYQDGDSISVGPGQDCRPQDRFANPFIGAERGYVDEVIPPHTTRSGVCRAFNMLRNKTVENPWKKHENIPL